MIRRALLLLTAVLVLAACQKEEHEPEPLSISVDTAVLRSNEGAQATLVVRSEYPWTAVAAGDGFDIEPLSGQRGQTNVTVTARGANDGRTRATLGQVTFSETSLRSESTLTVAQSPAIAPQTVLLYMPGRGLLTYFEKNIDGIRAAVNASVPGDGRILVCYQPESQTKAQLLEIFYDAKTGTVATEKHKEYISFNAGNPDHVHQLLADAAETAPAQHYGLIIGCHGKAWVPAAGGYLSSMSTGPRSPEHDEDLWIPSPGAKQTRSFGDSGYELDITDLADILAAQSFRPEYLVFDDCFMASIEVLYDLRQSVSYVIASPCEIMGTGFPYKQVVPWLFTDDGTGHDLGKVCYEFWNFYMNDFDPRRSEQSGCISLAVMSEIGKLAPIMQRINSAAKKTYDPDKLQYYEGLTRHLFYDLQHYVELSCADTGLVTEFNAQLDKAFPKTSRLHTPSFYSVYNLRFDEKNKPILHPVTSYSGVSTSEQSQNSSAVKYWQSTAWYRATH